MVATKITGGLNVNAQNIREDLEASLKSHLEVKLIHQRSFSQVFFFTRKNRRYQKKLMNLLGGGTTGIPHPLLQVFFSITPIDSESKNIHTVWLILRDFHYNNALFGLVSWF